MHITRNAAYTLVTTLLLFTVSVAVQRTFSGQAPKAGEELVGPTSRLTSKPVAYGAASSSGEADGSSIDAEALDSDRPWTTRAPSRNADGAPDQTLAGSSLTSARDQAASDSRDWTWSNPLSVLAPLFSPRSGVSGGTPGIVAPGVDSAPTASSPADSGPVREVFFASREEAACESGQREFVMDDLRSLHVCVAWTGLSGTYSSQLTFLSPDGHAYQTLTLAFATPDAPTTGATMDVGGRQYAIKRAGSGAQGEALVVARLPVAGTYITQHNLAGGWTVRIALNGKSVDQHQFALQATP
jgi:hypothetical protein